jgi:hypothetical protein
VKDFAGRRQDCVFMYLLVNDFISGIAKREHDVLA